MIDRRRASPIYLLAGKGSYNKILKQIYARAGKDRPGIAYIATASEDNRGFFFFISKILKLAGPCEIKLAPLAGAKADPRKAREIIESADLVCISGGDVELGMKGLAHGGIIGLLEKKYSAGTPFFGLSAGAIMLCRQWVAWSDSEDDSTARYFDCLGFADLICDVHDESCDWEDLRMLLKLSPADTVGYGIRTGGALRVDPDGAIEIISGKVDRIVQK
ncbi:MAG: Type 1 glutamine amidotransferase-like domain-containing protein [bacterium]|nr:Type 1 glutamine amidotransferase-like domain-containing protein [bacterium]